MITDKFGKRYFNFSHWSVENYSFGGLHGVQLFRLKFYLQTLSKRSLQKLYILFISSGNCKLSNTIFKLFIVNYIYRKLYISNGVSKFILNELFEPVTTWKFRGRFDERIKSWSQNVHYFIIVEEISIRYSLKNRMARYFFCEFGKFGVSSTISLQWFRSLKWR